MSPEPRKTSDKHGKRVTGEEQRGTENRESPKWIGPVALFRASHGWLLSARIHFMIFLHSSAGLSSIFLTTSSFSNSGLVKG